MLSEGLKAFKSLKDY